MTDTTAKFVYDILIVGGGINGCGIARDATRRGLSVLLCEKGDLGGGTSSKSSKLIHGGLRYLERYEFRLVREALQERERLMRIAPHLICERRFVLPHEKHLRPRWLLRFGLFLYDHLAVRHKLHKSHSVNLAHSRYGSGLKARFKHGFVYSDCSVDDARLVLTNALSARQAGATILTYTRCGKIEAKTQYWQATLYDAQNRPSTVYAKTLINAAGPWGDQVNAIIVNGSPSLARSPDRKLVKGSHIVVPQLYRGDHAYILQNRDKRIVFALPYERESTLIGTTDETFTGDPDDVPIAAHEIDYLCAVCNRYFEKQITPNDVIWHYAGVRPLYGGMAHNLSDISRDYILRLYEQPLPFMDIIGGKITTYRKLAEHALTKLAPCFPNMPDQSRTADEPLVGGYIDGDPSHYLTTLKKQYAWLPPTQLHRYFRCYGSCVYQLLCDCRRLEDLGEHFGGDLYVREVLYLLRFEGARNIEDILWRRTKLGLFLSPAQKNRLADFLSTVPHEQKNGTVFTQKDLAPAKKTTCKKNI